jgi:acetyltransferase
MSAGHYLSRIFEPRSVALVGASEKAGKVGALILDNLLAGGYRGELFAVNPKYSSVRGLACAASVERIGRPVDLAVIATPAPTVPAIIEECGRAGIGAAVVISAGFAESGPEGVALEKTLLESAHRHKVRLLGPNCVGLMRPLLGLNATFGRGQALAGSLALVSQSGAVCTAMLDWAAPNGVGFSSVVSLGGSSDLDFGEVIDYLAADAATEHILLYIEGVRDGRRLVSALRAAARAKPVIVMKVGRHPAGSRAAVSHTGAIVGNDDIFDAVVRRTGAVRVTTIGELVMAAQALASHVRPVGERLAIVTNGGGPGVMAADRAADLGIPLASLAPATIARLQRVLPAHWSHGNPVDLIGDADAQRYGEAVSACLADDGVDGVLAILTPQAMTQAGEAALAVAAAARGSVKPVLACWMGEASVEAARAQLVKSGLPVFRVPEMAVETFAHLAAFHRNQRALMQAPGPRAAAERADVDAARAVIRKALDEGRRILNATESKALLAAFHIPIAQSILVDCADEAVRAAGVVRFPVAMKIDSPDITHKSDVGGVSLALADAPAVRLAYAEMMEAVRRDRPDAKIRGVSIEPMVSAVHGRELMAGIVSDPIFGPAITFGAGGIAVEILKDRAVALPPLDSVLVDHMIRGTRVAAMLGEFRHLPAVSRAALDAVLLRVSEIACELAEVEELDVNPIMANEHGVIAIDARVVVREVAPGRAPYSHLAVRPYPTTLVSRFRLADGTEICVRPIRPEDAGLERDFIAALSPETMRRRFLGSIRTLDPATLARFTQIDYDREMALIALAGTGADEREVAVCRYFTLPDAASCEYAIVIADAWQRRGIGRQMMTRLITVARAQGLATMTGVVDASNSGMLDLCAKLGFTIVPEPGDPLVKFVSLDLGAQARVLPR